MTRQQEEQIAAMLRSGATYAQITRRLHVDSWAIYRVRTRQRIPLPEGRAKRTRAQLDAATRQAIAMLRTGATTRQIHAATHISYNAIAALRRALNLPRPQRTVACRTPEETYALYAVPAEDGHARWQGPWAGRMPQIHHPGRRGRKESALRVGFRMRHGREPVGYVRPTCGKTWCVASGHLMDRPMRDHLNRTYGAIFGRASR